MGIENYRIISPKSGQSISKPESQVSVEFPEAT
jgi:hypothetical protein